MALSWKSLALLLRFTGNEVEVAYDGLQAVAAAERLRPDVILLDLGMPTLDGYGAARRIRAEAWGKRIALIALMGWGQDLVRTHTQEAGFDLHLVKPVDMNVLNALLAKLPDASRCMVG